ncbi:dynamin-binding protein-like [Scyliorhinus torazame]|uniref:dynamin-binding protein-like n=1 Tax=Scyliorhinus torazame TaxID=75743 RepID=UPI003B5BE6F0
MHHRTRDSLKAMLERPLEEQLQCEALENLEFCCYSIRSMEKELQTVKDMTLLSTDHRPPPEPSPITATPHRPEQKMMEKRAKVIEELLQTEADYIKDLEMCVDKVLIPLENKQLQQVDCDALFGNIHTVIEVSRRLLGELEYNGQHRYRQDSLQLNVIMTWHSASIQLALQQEEAIQGLQRIIQIKFTSLHHCYRGIVQSLQSRRPFCPSRIH